MEIERLAQFIAEADGYGASVWPALSEHTRGSYRDMARHMVRYFDELEEILAEILTKGGRF